MYKIYFLNETIVKTVIKVVDDYYNFSHGLRACIFSLLWMSVLFPPVLLLTEKYKLLVREMNFRSKMYVKVHPLLKRWKLQTRPPFKAYDLVTETHIYAI